MYVCVYTMYHKLFNNIFLFNKIHINIKSIYFYVRYIADYKQDANAYWNLSVPSAACETIYVIVTRNISRASGNVLGKFNYWRNVSDISRHDLELA